MKKVKKSKYDEIPIDEFKNDKSNFRKEFLKRKKKLKEIKLIDLFEEKYKDILNRRILNKDTNRKIKVSSALAYDKYSYVYRLAKAMVDKNKKMPEDEASAIIKGFKDKFAKHNITDQEYNYLYTIESENKDMGADVENNKKNAMKILKFNSEEELKNLFGDGEILNIKCEFKKKGQINRWPEHRYDNRKRKWVIVGYSKSEQEHNEIIVKTILKGGFCRRTIFPNKKVVEMNYFRVSPDSPKGTGSTMFQNQINNFKKMKMKKVETFAAAGEGYNGYYTWARLGYDFTTDKYKEKFKKRIQTSTSKDIKSVKSLSELMSFEEGRQFWKENGFEFSGHFLLADNSDSMFILKKYMENKNTS